MRIALAVLTTVAGSSVVIVLAMDSDVSDRWQWVATVANVIACGFLSLDPEAGPDPRPVASRTVREEILAGGRSAC